MFFSVKHSKIFVYTDYILICSQLRTPYLIKKRQFGFLENSTPGYTTKLAVILVIKTTSTLIRFSTFVLRLSTPALVAYLDKHRSKNNLPPAHVGRSSIIKCKSNCTTAVSEDIKVSYTYKTLSMLHTPLPFKADVSPEIGHMVGVWQRVQCVVTDETQLGCECGCLDHCFQKPPFLAVHTEMISNYNMAGNISKTLF